VCRIRSTAAWRKKTTAGHFREKREHLSGRLPESRGQNLALTVLDVPHCSAAAARDCLPPGNTLGTPQYFVMLRIDLIQCLQRWNCKRRTSDGRWTFIWHNVLVEEIKIPHKIENLLYSKLIVNNMLTISWES